MLREMDPAYPLTVYELGGGGLFRDDLRRRRVDTAVYILHIYTLALPSEFCISYVFHQSSRY